MYPVWYSAFKLYIQIYLYLYFRTQYVKCMVYRYSKNLKQTNQVIVCSPKYEYQNQVYKLQNYKLQSVLVYMYLTLFIHVYQHVCTVLFGEKS